MADQPSRYLHESEPGLFREALAYTEAQTGFQASMIEKDYYCSLVLDVLFRKTGASRASSTLVFKGGTCLSKVYTDFYRLSEDLDFVISIPTEMTRNQRRSKVKSMKTLFDALPKHVPGVTIAESLIGHNKNRQYIGILSYASAVMQKQELIKLEIGLREPLLQEPQLKTAQTLARNPFMAEQTILPAIQVQVMSLAETYAEKVRAALTRRAPAIRDFFDLSPLILETVGLDLEDADFLDLVIKKVNVIGYGAVDISSEKKAALEQQLERQLKPVLRASDYSQFDFDATFEHIVHIAERLA